MMELQHSCILPSNAPALPEPELDIPSRVLQERSGNGRQSYVGSSGPWKQSPSSPIENIYSHNLGGSYFTGNYATELNGDKSEEQIEQETKRLLRIVRRCEKYIKYRERQPQTTKEKEQRWPDHMEEAFFRGAIQSLLI
jgi:transcriptional enhancer factor